MDGWMVLLLLLLSARARAAGTGWIGHAEQRTQWIAVCLFGVRLLGKRPRSFVQSAQTSASARRTAPDAQMEGRRIHSIRTARDPRLALSLRSP
ncbi:hypothetical protein IWX90DRAFT_444831 [Phyllosticta citrichinensis]|uniref:Secreted protein n=1 Tax=Phyllosticta citrichinensis TaxID=1130410 RepID=A0ABR1XGJ2_9PEZI